MIICVRKTRTKCTRVCTLFIHLLSLVNEFVLRTRRMKETIKQRERKKQIGKLLSKILSCNSNISGQESVVVCLSYLSIRVRSAANPLQLRCPNLHHVLIRIIITHRKNTDGATRYLDNGGTSQPS